MGRPRKSKAEVSASRRAAAITRHHGPDAAAAAQEAQPSRTVTGTAQLPGFNNYDAAVAANRISYSEARTREQVREQEILNDIKAMELEKARGKLITAEEMRDKFETVRDAIEAEGRKLVGPLVALFPPELKATAAKGIGLAVERMRIAMADHIDSVGGGNGN